MSYFDEDTISASNIALKYRSPDQGVSAKSNSNVSYNDYRKMTPSRGGSYTTGNAVVVPSGTVISAEDFHNSGGFTPTSTSYSTGSTKGASTTTVVGCFSSSAKSIISSSANSTAQGFFGLGATGGSSGAIVHNVNNGLAVGNVAAPNNNGVTSIIGIGSSQVSGAFGGTMWFIMSRGGYQTGSVGSTEWNTIRVRTLYQGGSITTNGFTFYNATSTFQRSDGWSFSNNGVTGIWQATYGSIGTVDYSTTAGWVGLYPCIVELD